MKEDAERWLKQANEDLKAAQYNFDGRKHKVAAFMCQQSAEKALKALLIKKTNEFPKIHDLTKLARLLNCPDIILEFCAKINPAYTASRYPDSAKRYTKIDVQTLLKYTKEILQWIKKNLD